MASLGWRRVVRFAIVDALVGCTWSDKGNLAHIRLGGIG